MSHIVKIQIEKTESLSKDEIAFNSILIKIEKAKVSFAKTKALLDNKQKYAEKYLRPLLEEEIEFKLKILTVYWNAYNDGELGKSKELFAHYLENEIRNFIMGPFELSDENHDKLESWSRELTSFLYDEDYSKEEDSELDQLLFSSSLDELKKQYQSQGIDIDIDGLNFDMSEEELRAELNERVADAKRQAHFKEPIEKKSKRELNAEALEKEKEEAKKRNISSIYKSLAKIIHPDLEVNEEERVRKEEFMKKVNRAYKESDLYTLIALEQEWISGSASRLAELTSAQIKIYIEVFREQLKTISAEEHLLYFKPEYDFIRNFVNFPSSLKNWKHEKELIISQNNCLFLESMLEDLTKSKKERKAIIKEVLANFKMEMDDDDDFMFFEY